MKKVWHILFKHFVSDRDTWYSAFNFFQKNDAVVMRDTSTDSILINNFHSIGNGHAGFEFPFPGEVTVSLSLSNHIPGGL